MVFFQLSILNMRCNICSKDFKGFKGLTTHIGKLHKDVDLEQYYLKYFSLKDLDLKCPNCLRKRKFFSFVGYLETCGNKGCIKAARNMKQVKTCLIKYGCSHPWGNQQVKANKRQSFLNTFGVDNPRKSSIIIERSRITNRLKYGVDSYSKTDEFKEIIKEKSSITMLKSYKTKKNNNSFNTSEPEDDYYTYLVEKFGKVIRNYRDDRYPFRCDFYIPKLDLFIELNLHWTHGDEPFNLSNVEHLKKLSEWQNRAGKSDFYKTAVSIWTQKDVEKRDVAKKNNLNYLELFDKNKQILDNYFNRKGGS